MSKIPTDAKPVREEARWVGGAILLALVFGFIMLGVKPLHLDEVATYMIADGSGVWNKLWRYEGNMWLYYALMHLWTAFGSSELLLRMPSVLFGALSLIPVYLFTRVLMGIRIARLTIYLLALHVLFVRDMQFARGYALVLLLTSLATLLVLMMNRKNASFWMVIAYATTGLLAVYTHVYAAFILAAHGVYILLHGTKESIFRIVSAGFIVAIGVIPLALSPAFKSGQIDWITPPNAYALAAALVTLLGDWLPLAVLAGSVLGGWIVRTRARFLIQPEYQLVVLLTGLPFVMAALFSWVVKPIFSPQYLVVSLPAVMIVLAAAVSSFRNTILRRVIIALLVCASLIRLGYWYSGTPQRFTTVVNSNAPWDYITTDIATAGRSSDMVIVLPTYTHIAYDYYSARLGSRALPSVPLQPSHLATGMSSPFDRGLLEQLPGSATRVWIIANKRGGSHLSREEEQVLDAFKQSHSKRLTRTYYETTVTLYERR